MAKKATKKAAKTAKKKTPAKAAKADDCDTCDNNDAILKTIFIVLGVAVVVAAFYVGYLTGQGGGATNVAGGSADGKLVIVEYSDFECPFCQRFYNDAYQQIRSTYGDQVEIEYKHFPLSIHPNAQKAAEASECARDQGSFWDYHDRLFEQGGFSIAQLKAHAGALGLDQAAFDACLDSDEKASIVAAHMAEATERGVRGTPSFWINGELIVGAQPFSVFKQKIDAALSGAAAPAPAPSPSPTPAPTAAPVDVSADDDAVLGNPNAPVTLIEFTDYECPFCARHFTQTYPQIKENFIDTGKVKLVVRDFPLSFHVNAQKAAEAAECAGEQGKYFEMHDILFENIQSLSVANYKAWAGDLGLNQAEFDNCLDSGEMAQEVRDDFADGQAAGVTGTPGFFVNGVKINGAQPYSVFEAAINAALEE